MHAKLRRRLDQRSFSRRASKQSSPSKCEGHVDKRSQQPRLTEGCLLPLVAMLLLRAEHCLVANVQKQSAATEKGPRVASQAAWNRMENGPKAENGNKMAEQKGKKIAHAWPKIRQE